MPGFIPDFVEMHQNLARETGGKPFRLKRPTIQRFPVAAERGYAAALVAIIKAIKGDIDEFLIPEIGRISRESGLRGDDARLDVADVSAIIEGIKGRINVRIDNTHLRALEELTARYANETSKFSRAQTIRQIRRMIGFDAFPSEVGLKNLLDLSIKENAKLITKLSGDYVDRVTSSVRRNVQAGARPEVIAKDIKKQFDVSMWRARFIARDQTNKLNGDLTRMRQTGLGIEEYTWRTSRDERVRPSHRLKEGNVYSWDDPPADTGHPGYDFNCRCSAEPFLEGVPPQVEDKKKILQTMKDKRAAMRKRLGPKATKVAKESKAEARILASKPRPPKPPTPKPAPTPAPKPAASLPFVPTPPPAPKPAPVGPDEAYYAKLKAEAEAEAVKAKAVKAAEAKAVKAAEAKAVKAKAAEAKAVKAAEAKAAEAKAVKAAEAKAAEAKAAKAVKAKAAEAKAAKAAKAKAAEAKAAKAAKAKAAVEEAGPEESPFEDAEVWGRPIDDPAAAREFDAVSHWVESSTSRGSVALKTAAKQEFGLDGVAFSRDPFTYTSAEIRSARRTVRSMYDKTQAEFKRRNIKTIRVYRGTTKEYTHKGALESWSEDPGVASGFSGVGGRVLTEEVPVERILNGFDMGHWHDGSAGDELEWIIMR